MKILCTILVLSAAAISAYGSCGGVDDFANVPSSATMLGTNVQSGVIDYDTDEDWFSFHALPMTTYSISLSTSTVWDATVTLDAPDGATILKMTNTARASPVQAVFTNNGAAGIFYLRVQGFVGFTTGTYAIVITPVNFSDTDGDGLSDSWETNYFGNLTNTATGDNDGDGFNNLAEYYLGTSPTSSVSGLLVQNIQTSTTNVTVGWQSRIYGSYRVLANTNLLGAQAWVALGTNIELEGSGTESFSQSNPTNIFRNYRVEFIY